MSDTSQANALRPLCLSYGIEFEFLVAYLWDDEADPEENKPEVSPVIILPKQPYAVDEDIDVEIRDLVREALRKRGVPVPGEGLPAAKSSAPVYDGSGNLTKLFDVFSIVHDNSLGDTWAQADDRYHWAGVELKSLPCYSSSEAAAQIIRYVLNFLKSEFRVKVNDTCGLHVHVGAGKQQFSLSNMKRVAGLLWAADPLLSCLHMPSRRRGMYVGSIREQAVLDRSPPLHFGENDRLCQRYLSKDIRFGEYPIEWRQKNDSAPAIKLFAETRKPGHYEPFLGIPEPRGKGTESVVPVSPSGDADSSSTSDTGSWQHLTPQKEPTQRRDEDATKQSVLDDGKMADNTAAEMFALVDKLRSAPEVTLKPIRQRRIPRVALPDPIPNIQTNTVFAGVAKIMTLQSSCDLALLMGPKRNNYNLANYNCIAVAYEPESLHTVEFREAAGDMDTEWSEVWVRIAVGLVRFAIQTPVEDYVAVLLKCNASDEDPHSYDVVDLLDHIGLVAEADHVERRLEKHAQEWGYLPPSDK